MEKEIKVSLESYGMDMELAFKCNLAPDEMERRKAEVEKLFNENAISTDFIFEVLTKPNREGWLNIGENADENGYWRYIVRGKLKRE